MIIIREFAPRDLVDMRVQPAQLAELHMLGDLAAYGQTVFDSGPAFSAIDEHHRVIGCAGLIINRPHHATAWAMLGDLGPHGMLRATRAALSVLEATSMRRVDAIISTSFTAARKWAIALGFRFEGTMQGWGPDGSDWALYARVKGA
jgi:hypothetical protein